jgi:hypothetical protein
MEKIVEKVAIEKSYVEQLNEYIEKEKRENGLVNFHVDSLVDDKEEIAKAVLHSLEQERLFNYTCIIDL